MTHDAHFPSNDNHRGASDLRDPLAGLPGPDDTLDLIVSTADRSGTFTRYFPNALDASLAETDAAAAQGEV